VSRSVWKGPFIDVNLIRRFDELISHAVERFRIQNKLQAEDLTKKFLKEYSVEILNIAKQFSEEDPIEVWSRRSFVAPEFLGFSFLVYNGRVFKKIVIKNNMLGRKFGEFAVTKRIGPNIHYPKKKKKK
jgi:small subunit ribosomal protein S19